MMRVLSSLILFLLLAVPLPAMAGKVEAKVFDKPRPVAAFGLADQSGKPFGPEELKGRWSLMFLGYTNCPDVCPFTLANLAAVLKAYQALKSEVADPRVVFVSVDPERDTEVLADYLAYFDPGFVGLTGARGEIDALVAAMDGFYRLEKKDEADVAYSVSHSATVAVISPDGGLKSILYPPFPPDDTARFLRELFSPGSTN